MKKERIFWIVLLVLTLAIPALADFYRPYVSTRTYYYTSLLKTGQTTQYNSKEDDGYWEKGYAKSYTVHTTGNYAGTTNITLNGKTHALSNNCVTDNRTGLMWARYVPDGDIGPDGDGKLYWIDDTNDEDIFDLSDQANAGSLGGHTDWRVPNIIELESLMKHEGSSPLIDTTTFPSTPGAHHWSSTTKATGTTNAIVLLFHLGETAVATKTTGKYCCRLVRGG